MKIQGLFKALIKFKDNSRISRPSGHPDSTSEFIVCWNQRRKRCKKIEERYMKKDIEKKIAASGKN